MRYHYDKITHPSGIRLLEIHSGLFEDPVICDLVPAILGEPNGEVNNEPPDCAGRTLPYIALSYVWGDQSNIREIKCGNGVLQVTENLHVALRYIRMHLQDPKWFAQLDGPVHKNVYVWADAVCIHQEDLEERGQQVSMMGEIYAQATSTILWLGEETKDVQGWSNALTGLHDRLPDNPEGRRRVMALPVSDNIDDHFLTDPRWQPILALVKRPWFTRKWVIQETIHSKIPKLVCGFNMVDWSKFQFLMAITLYFDVYPYNSSSDPPSQVGLRNARSMARIRLLFSPSVNTLLLQDLIYNFALLECSDPRDHIYALLSIASHLEEGSSALRIRPVYTRGFREVFTQFAKRTILHDKSIVFFSWTYFEPRVEGYLPSWVPDIRNINGERNFTSSKKQQIWASANTTVCASIVNDTKLMIRGRRIDTIQRVGKLFIGEIPAEQLELHKTDARNIPAYWLEWRDECKAIAREALGLQDTAELPEYYWQTLMWNRTEDMGSLTRASHELVQRLRDLMDNYMNMKADWPHITFEEASSWSLRTRKLRVALFAVCRSRRFAATASGRLAMVPLATVPGDAIWICDGGCHPYVMRPCADNEHNLLGACYLHGMMEGEAMEVGEFKDETCVIV